MYASIYIYIYIIYIYIYCHPQTDCFVLSELFSVARLVGHSKTGSKPIQLYVRLSLGPLGQQAYHVWLRESLRYLCSNSSSRLFTFLYPIGYQSAQFFRRDLHYASGGRKFLHQNAQPPWGSVYIYIYIEREREWENGLFFKLVVPSFQLIVGKDDLCTVINIIIILLLHSSYWSLNGKSFSQQRPNSLLEIPAFV